MLSESRIKELENEIKQNRKETEAIRRKIEEMISKDVSSSKRERMVTTMAKLDISRIKEYDPQLAVEVFKVYMEIQKLRINLDEAKKSEKRAWAENIANRTEIEGLKSQVDILTSTLSRLQSRFDEKVKETNSLRIEHEDLHLRMGIAESSFKTLIESLESMHEKVSRRYTESIPEAIRSEMTKNIAFLIEQVNHVISAKESNHKEEEHE